MIVLAKISPHYIRIVSDSCWELLRAKSLKASPAAILHAQRPSGKTKLTGASQSLNQCANLEAHAYLKFAFI